MTYAVKMRERGKRAWWFVTPKGDGTRLRIHASRFADQAAADAFVARYGPQEPDLEFKVQPL